MPKLVPALHRFLVTGSNVDWWNDTRHQRAPRVNPQACQGDIPVNTRGLNGFFGPGQGEIQKSFQNQLGWGNSQQWLSLRLSQLVPNQVFVEVCITYPLGLSWARPRVGYVPDLLLSPSSQQTAVATSLGFRKVEGFNPRNWTFLLTPRSEQSQYLLSWSDSWGGQSRSMRIQRWPSSPWLSLWIRVKSEKETTVGQVIYASIVPSVCGWYAVGMWLVCGRYVVGVWSVCGSFIDWGLVSMWLCGRDVVGMWSIRYLLTFGGLAARCSR